MKVVKDQLDLTANRPSGFDYMRIILSVSVIVWHSVLICYGPSAEGPFWTGPFRPLIYVVLPAFFALSGFLVASSLERNSISSFLILRALRIYPALSVEVIISGLLIGPLLTTYSYYNYFTSDLFITYLGNMIGWIHYLLPGVFTDNPAGATVNLQLWTVPYELECYAAIAGIALFGLYARPKLLLGLLLTFSLMIVAYKFGTGHLLALDSRPPGRLIVLCFLFGVVIYALRTLIPYNKYVFWLSVLAVWILLDFRQTIYLAPFPIAYVTVFLGLQNPPRISLLRGADYSYGIYLYGFPIQQTISYLLPEYRFWYVNIPLALIVSGAFAFLSWHLVEARVMARKKDVLAAAAAFGHHIKICLGAPMFSRHRSFK